MPWGEISLVLLGESSVAGIIVSILFKIHALRKLPYSSITTSICACWTVWAIGVKLSESGILELPELGGEFLNGTLE